MRSFSPRGNIGENPYAIVYPYRVQEMTDRLKDQPQANERVAKIREYFEYDGNEDDNPYIFICH